MEVSELRGKHERVTSEPTERRYEREGNGNGRDHYVVDRSLPYRFAHSHYHPSHPRLSPYGSAPKEARRAYRTERETRVNGKDYNVM